MYQITGLCLEHNHVCHKDDFAHYPKNRHLDSATENLVATAMNAKAKPAILVNQIKDSLDIIVTSKDLQNIKAKINKGK